MSSNDWLAFLFLSFIIVSFSFSSLEFTFLLCSETHIKAEYAIQEPVPCKQHLHEHTKKCNVSVFHSEHNMFIIPGISCQQITTTTTATFYFFGAQAHSSATDYSQVPSLFECPLWKRTLIATNVGKLTKKSNTVFRTENKPCFEYRWPTTRHHTTSNVILSRFTLLYDSYKHKLFTPFQQLDHCNVHHGFCTFNHLIFVWHPPQKIDCPQLKHVQNTSITLHMSDTHSVYRLEIPSLGISIHHWHISSAKTQCLGADAICGFSQFVIIPITSPLERHRPLGKNRRGSTTKLFAAYLQDLEYNVSDALKHLGQ